MHNVDLKVGGKSYSGWKTVRVSRSLEAICGSFDIGISENLLPRNWVAEIDDGLPIDVGNECTLVADGEILVTGYVDDVARSLDSRSHEASISGRDKTCDLVDCSAVHKQGMFKNRDLADIALALLEPFKIGLVVNADHGEPFRRTKIEPGESVFELLDRLARMRGVLLTTDGAGNLVVTRAGLGLSATEASTKLTRLGTSLNLGQNISTIRTERSQRDRYSKYIVKSQIPGDDNTDAGYNPKLLGVADNETVSRYRPLVMVSEHPGNAFELSRRAQWERGVREGRSTRITVSVAGWRHDDGFWTPNRIVRLEARQLGIEGADMLIVSVAHTLDESGTRTEMSLTWPWAFDPLPTPAKEDRWFRIR